MQINMLVEYLHIHICFLGGCSILASVHFVVVVGGGG